MPSGAILGIGGPPPCETFTAARLLADGPPPVRSHDELWGLPSNSQRQWAQTSLGNTLMRFILDMCICRTSGIPDVGSPSEALRRLQCASYVTFDQCVFGCPRRKPTTLLLIRLPWLRNQILRLGEGGRCPHGQGQHAALQGRDESGSFRTAVAKIYPAAMNAAISHAIAHFVVKTFGLELAPEGLAEDPMDFSQMDFVSKCVVQPDCCLVLADS